MNDGYYAEMYRQRGADVAFQTAADDAEKLRDTLARVYTALIDLLDLCDHANSDAWTNGVTDEFGTVDEGEVRALEVIGRARAVKDGASVPPSPPVPSAAEGALPRRGDVGRPECTRDPIFVLRWRDKNREPSSDRWHVETVWFTREEAEAWAEAHAYRWPEDRHGKRWQVYCIPADGELATLLRSRTERPAPAVRREGDEGGA